MQEKEIQIAKEEIKNAKNTIPLPHPTKKPAVGLVFLIEQNIVKKKYVYFLYVFYFVTSSTVEGVPKISL